MSILSGVMCKTFECPLIDGSVDEGTFEWGFGAWDPLGYPETAHASYYKAFGM